MQITVLTLFPELITQSLAYSIPKRAQERDLLKVEAKQLRDWAIDERGTVDDSPYGGGPGMVLRVDVADKAFKAIDPKHTSYRIMLTPDGQQLDQKMVKKLAKKKKLTILCGRYEGFDARIDKLVDCKLSIGNYVLSGGELASLVVIDAITRLIPGVLGNEESLSSETFEDDVTDFPQYTRPEVYQGDSVPPVLLSGHHAEITKWRTSQQKKITPKSSVDTE